MTQRQIPDTQRVILRAGHQRSSVGTHGQTIQRSRMLAEGLQLRTGNSIPEFGGLVSTGRNDSPVLRGKSGHHHGSRMSLEHDFLGR